MKKRLFKFLAIGAATASAVASVSFVVSCGSSSSQKMLTSDAFLSRKTYSYNDFVKAFPQYKDKIVNNIVVPDAFAKEPLPENFFLPDSVTEIGIGAFRDATINNKFVFPLSIRIIARYAFQRANLPEGLIVPKTVGTIGYKAFGDLKIPDKFSFDPYFNSVQVNGGAFAGSDFKKDYPTKTAKVNLTTFVALKEGGFAYEEKAIYNEDPKQGTVSGTWDFPIQVTSIRNGTFTGAIFPSTWKFPKWVTEIESYAFQDATLPTDFVLPAIMMVHANAFLGATFPGSFRIDNVDPKKTSDAVRWEGGQTGREPFTNATFGNQKFDQFTWDVLNAYGQSFDNTKLKVAPIDEVLKGGTVIPDFAYANVDFTTPSGQALLTSIEQNTSITEISSRAFINAKFNTFALPQSVTKIGVSAFQGATFTSDFTIPHTVAEIGEAAFTEATFNGTVTYDGASEEISNSLFADAEFKSSFKFGTNNDATNVTKIAAKAFMGTTLDENFKLPTSIKEIGLSAFSGTTFKGKVNIDATYTNLFVLGDEAFSSARFLKGFDFSASKIMDLGRSTFAKSYIASGASALTAPIIPNVKYIKRGLFSGLTDEQGNPGSLPNGFVLPTTIVSLGDQAFADTQLGDSFNINQLTKLQEIGVSTFATLTENVSSTWGHLPDSFANLPASLRIIKTGAFSKSTLPAAFTLSHFTSKDKNATTGLWVTSGAFEQADLSKTTDFQLPDGTTLIAFNTFQRAIFPDSTSTYSLNISTVTGIGDNAFTGTLIPFNLKDATALKSISQVAFANAKIRKTYANATNAANLFALPGQTTLVVDPTSFSGTVIEGLESYSLNWDNVDPNTYTPRPGAKIVLPNVTPVTP